MNAQDIALLDQVRAAGKSIGEVFCQRADPKTLHNLMVILLDDLSGYNISSQDRLRHEIALGVLDAFTSEELESQRSGVKNPANPR